MLFISVFIFKTSEGNFKNFDSHSRDSYSIPHPLIKCVRIPAERGNCSFQLTNSNNSNRHAYFVSVCVTCTQGYLKLAGWPNTAWIRRGMPGGKTSDIF